MKSIHSLFILFLAVPLLEIYLLIKIGGVIGALPTVAMVVLTAVVGSLLIRQQGFSTLQRARRGMEAGQLPAMEMLEGVGLLLAGALLLTPGFFTDAVGFLLLIPPVRRRLIRKLLQSAVVIQSPPFDRNGPQGGGPRTYEGEYWDDDDPRLR